MFIKAVLVIKCFKKLYKLNIYYLCAKSGVTYFIWTIHHHHHHHHPQTRGLESTFTVIHNFQLPRLSTVSLVSCCYLPQFLIIEDIYRP